MRPRFYAQLCAMARRECGDPASAEDVVQDALLAAVQAGRTDFTDPATGRWLSGVVRNQARMHARTAARRRRRDTHWQTSRPIPEPETKADIKALLDGLPRALKAVAALVLTGHNRREIAYLLALPDTALRQRITALKRHMVARGIAMPADCAGLNLDLAYGRIRNALVPALVRQGGLFASHDPDGHVFLVQRSQTGERRQQDGISQQRT